MALLEVLGSALVEGGVSAFNDWRQNTQRKELSKYEFRMNKKMWDLQNQYNSPLAQMQRLRDAGLNPKLVYGQGAVGNTSSPAPKYVAPEFESNISLPNPLETLNQYHAIRLQEKQEAVLAKEAALKSSQIVNNKLKAIEMGVRTGILRHDDKIKAAQANIASELATHQLSQQRATANNAETQGKILEFERQMKEIDLKWKNNGVNPTDAYPFRLISNMLADNGASPTEIIEFWKQYPTIFHWMSREDPEALDPFGMRGNRNKPIIR